jgi:hypothetical protein
VETGQVRLGGTPAAARLLTLAIVLVLAGLLGLLAMQGGTLLVSSIVNHTDPSQIPNVVLDPGSRACPRGSDARPRLPHRPRPRVAAPGARPGSGAAN